MSIYSVHEPPPRAAGLSPDAERFAFVRDGFSFWAFAIAPLWMLWHRLWLVLLGYLVLSVGLGQAMTALGASSASVAAVNLLISLLVGLEASTLQRFTLTRRGWRNVGVVSGYDVEDAERRFFDAWARRASSHHGAAGPPPPSGSVSPAVQPPPLSRMAASTPGVIGLFPEPGVRR
jgi:hypothetical protein